MLDVCFDSITSLYHNRNEVELIELFTVKYRM